MPTNKTCSFSLIELLVVVAVIALLFGILLPAIGVAQRSAGRSRTKAQFQQYILGYERFRAEYGFYPSMGSSNPRFELIDSNVVFIETLSGRGIDGDVKVTGYAASANPHRIPFYEFTHADFGSPDGSLADQIVDGFENPDIVFVIDSDGDGWIPVHDLGLIPDMPLNPIRAGVVVYSRSREGSPDQPWVYSWQ